MRKQLSVLGAFRTLAKLEPTRYQYESAIKRADRVLERTALNSGSAWWLTSFRFGRVAAAVLLVALLWLGSQFGGPRIGLAQVIDAVSKTSAVSYREQVQVRDNSGHLRHPIQFVKVVALNTGEIKREVAPGQFLIVNPRQKKVLELDEKSKTAFVRSMRPTDVGGREVYSFFKQLDPQEFDLVASASGVSSFKAKPGSRLRPGAIVNVATASGLPIRIEAVAIGDGERITIVDDDIKFDDAIALNVFDTKVPAGFTIKPTSVLEPVFGIVD